MSIAARRFARLSFAFYAGAMILAPCAAADPDIDTESATAVIDELQQQGYTVEINGVPSGDTTLLTNCKVTAIDDPDYPSPDPTSTTVISVDVACPIQRG